MDISSPLFRYAQLRTIFSHTILHRTGFLAIALGLLALLYQGFVVIAPYIPSLPEYISSVTPQTLYGLALLFIPLGISALQISVFLSSKDRTMKRRTETLEDQLTIDAAQALSRAVRHSAHSFVKQLMTALATFPPIQELYARLGIRLANLSLPTEQKKEQEDFHTLLEHASRISKTHKHPLIHSSDLAVACLLTHPLLVQWYQQHDLSEEDIIRLSDWIEQHKQMQNRKKQFWLLENLINKPPIGLSWIYGFTPVLSHSAEELTQWGHFTPSHRIVGRQKEIQQIESALCKANNANVLLVGPVGVGKKTTIEGVAERIQKGHSPLVGSRLFEIPGQVLAQMGESEAMKLAQEAVRAGNIILAVPDIHLAQAQEGSPQAQLLQHLAASNRLHVLATTDPHHFHTFLERNAGLLRYFTKLEVEEPSSEETRVIIREALPDFEYRHNVFFTYASVETVFQDAQKYLPNTPFPEKAMDMLESVGVWAQAHHLSFITPQTVNNVFAETFNVPATTATETEREVLLTLEQLMHERIIGQDAAVSTITHSLQRVRSGIERPHKPIGSFLFLGPTGVGKTETAKTLASIYFGSEDRLVRFDMSEYQTSESVDRFIGSTRTNTAGLFVSRVRDNSFSVVLLDEVEKAYHDLLNLLLQILDEGSLTDAFGDKVSFTQSIIIATSNAGAEFIREMQQRGLNPATNAQLVIEHLLQDQLFSPELLNRFDAVIVFHPLEKHQLLQIAKLQLDALSSQLQTRGYLFEPNRELLEKVVDLGYDPQFGARPMARAIQNTVETLIAQKILSGEIQKGALFTLTKEEIQNFK